MPAAPPAKAGMRPLPSRHISRVLLRFPGRWGALIFPICGFSDAWASVFPTRLYGVLDCRHTPNPWPEAREPGTQVVGANFAVIPRDALLFQREPVS